MSSGLSVVLVSAPPEAAASLARALVEDRVAACVGILPGLRSVYRWQGRIEEAEEVQLVIKTAQPFDRVCEAVRARHPYEVPEILRLDVADADEAYARWMRT